MAGDPSGLMNFAKDPIGGVSNFLYGNAGNVAPVNPAAVRDINPGGFYDPQQSLMKTPIIHGLMRPEAAAPTVSTGRVDQARNLEAQSRMGQSAAAGLAYGAATGQAPSVAAAQQAMGLDSALRSQAALANSARGGAAARASAQRSAQATAGDLQQQAVNQAAALRAGEIATARGQFGDITGQIRGYDQGQAGQEATIGIADAGNAVQTLGLNQENTRGLINLGLTADQLAQQDRQYGSDRTLAYNQLGVDRDLGILGQQTQRLVPSAQADLQRRGGALGAIGSGAGFLF